MRFLRKLSVFMTIIALGMAGAVQIRGAQGVGAAPKAAASAVYDDCHHGLRRWYRNSGEIYSGGQPNLTSNNVDQRPRGYDELPFAHA